MDDGPAAPAPPVNRLYEALARRDRVDRFDLWARARQAAGSGA